MLGMKNKKIPFAFDDEKGTYYCFKMRQII